MNTVVPKTMKALVCYAPDDYRYEEAYPVPACGPKDILIKTEACGVCAGDIKGLHGAARIWGAPGAEPYAKVPFIPGHEFVGRIVQMGDEVKGFEIGDRVAPEQIVPCGECRFCQSGKYWMCQVHNVFGFQNTNNGGMAEYVLLPWNARVHKVPGDLPLESALLVEPYGCAKHAVDRANMDNEDIVVISGMGTLGLGMVTYAAMKRPYKLVALDMDDKRLEKALQFGADLAWNPGKMDVVAEMNKLTDGYGCDIYIEAAGHTSSIGQGLAMIRKLGTFVEFSVFGEAATIDWSIIGDEKELDLLGAHLSPYAFPFVIEHIASGDLKTDGVVTRFFSVEEWQKAFEYGEGKDGNIKVALSFTE